MMVDASVHLRYSNFSQPWEVLDRTDWLSPGEREDLQRYSHRGRRRAWLAGRWVGKQLILETFCESVESSQHFSIRSLDEWFRPTRPTVRLGKQELPVSISITHSESSLLVALSTLPYVRVGVDLCPLRAMPSSFSQTWFTPLERGQIEQKSGGNSERTREICRLWAAKEAIYKACNRGESFAPHQIEVSWDRETWLCRYHDSVLKDELRLETWEVNDQVAVFATLRIPSVALPLTGVPHD